MERIEAMIDPVLREDIRAYKDERGYENTSQALRALIRAGLEHERGDGDYGHSLTPQERQKVVNMVVDELS
jgi:hypothetical protein